MAADIINKFGKMAGWNNVRIRMLGRTVEGITAISYEDSVEVENIYGAGGYPVGFGTGNYKAKCSLTLKKEECDAIQASLPPGKHFHDIDPFDIICEYEYNGKKIKDVIHSCMLPGRGVDVKQNDKSIDEKIELIVGGVISWNV